MKIKKSKQIFQPKRPINLKSAMLAQAREVRKMSDRSNGTRTMNYEQFCDAIDKEIHEGEFVGTDKLGKIPAKEFYKMTAKAMIEINPQYDLYQAFLDIIIR